MPDEVKREGKGGRIVLDLDTIARSAALVVDADQRAKEFVVHIRANRDRLPAVIAAIDTLGLDSRLKEVARKELAKSLFGLNELATSKIQEISTIFSRPLKEPEIFGRMPQINQALAAFDLGLNKRFAEIVRVAEILSLRLREQFRSFQITHLAPNPLWSDIIGALDRDPSAAERLALRINWYPNQWQRDCIRLKSRFEGSSPDEVRKQALIQGVILALGWEKEDEIPIQIELQSTWLHDDQHNLTTVFPMEIPARLFWNWIKEEAARAAGLWLIGFPYAPTVVLENYPDENSDWQLARFTTLPTDEQSLTRRGRPFGSGIFENREAFLVEIRLAVARIEDQDKRITQEGVAEALFQRALLSGDNAERQLRRWVKDFGFASWRDLLNRL